MGNTESKRQQEIKPRTVSRKMWRLAKVRTTHTSSLSCQVGPQKSSWWTCWGARPSGSPFSHPCREVQLERFWRVGFTNCNVANVLSQAGEGSMRPCRWLPEHSEIRKGTKQHMDFCISSWTGCWSSRICFWGACCQLPFLVPQCDCESLKSLDHFSQVLILQPAATQDVIN